MSPGRGLQLPARPANRRVKSRATCCGIGLGCASAAGRRQCSVKSESRAHHGSSLLSSAAPWAIWSLGASLVPQFGPQAAGEQVTGRGLALLEGA